MIFLSAMFVAMPIWLVALELKQINKNIQKK